MVKAFQQGTATGQGKLTHAMKSRSGMVQGPLKGYVQAGAGWERAGNEPCLAYTRDQPHRVCVGQSWTGIPTAETWLRPLGVSRGEMRMQMWHSTSRWGMWLGMLHGDCCLEAETQWVEGRQLKTHQVDKTICESRVLPPKHSHTQNTTWAMHPSTTVALDLVAGPAQGTLLVGKLVAELGRVAGGYFPRVWLEDLEHVEGQSTAG